MSGGWNTIESDAGVFTHLLERLGATGVQFEELVSLDVESLQVLRGSGPDDGTFQPAASETLFFAQQTIQNACGTQALLSVLLNLQEADIGPHLNEFKEFTRSLPPEIRGECLSNSELIRSVHNSFARSSPFLDETQRLANEQDDVYHFIAYTPINGVLYELDGLNPAPISHGSCQSAEFPAKVVPVIQRRIARYPPGEIRFNLIAMIRDPRIHAKEIDDVELLHSEEIKRKGWLRENALRQHNFVGFICDLLKGTIKAKQEEGDGKYDEWLEQARKGGSDVMETSKIAVE